MRVAVAGSHSTGKSTLIAAFIEQLPQYAYEPEAFETLADDFDVASAADAPTPEGLHSLLEYTVAEVARHPRGACVIHERSPVDYLAYAAAARGAWPRGVRAAFLAAHLPVVRASLRHLDLIVLLPVSAAGPFRARADEDPRFRRRVDESLRRRLVDDDYDLFGRGDSPRVVELAPLPERQLSELIRLTRAESA